MRPNKISHLFTYLVTIIMFFALIPTTVSAENNDSNSFTSTTTAIVTTDSKENQEIKIESYLTNKDTTEVTIDPCDIIFVVDQSKWMNTEEDAGAQREVIISYMNELLNSLASPTNGEEHRVAIAGYGRVNVGAVDNYDANIFPGIVSKGNDISFNTGYYTKNGFVTKNGWTDVPSSNMNGTELPQMSDSYRSAMTYDNAFMTLEEAEDVLNPDTMLAWYAGASRMDAGLTIAEQLGNIAKEHNPDRNLIVCILASSLPIQHTASTNQSIIRANAVITASEQLKNMGATIFGFGDYHASGKNIIGSMQDTEANFTSVMQQACSKPENFCSLSDFSNVKDAMNKLITEITISSAGDAVREYTIEANEFSTTKDTSSGNSTDEAKTITWKDIYNYYAEDAEKIINSAMTKVEFYNFSGYDTNGNPTFEQESNISFEVPLSDMVTDEGISYTTNLIPISPKPNAENNTDNNAKNDTDNDTDNDADNDVDNNTNNYYGYKVVITISAPITITYQWAEDTDGYVPANVVLPSPETIALGTTHSAPTIQNNNNTYDDHYVFDGWYTDKSCTQKYSDASTPDSSFTLYGKWKRYVVIEYYWDVWNNYQSPDDDAKIEYNEIPDIYTPDGISGYMFDGWYLDKDYTQLYEATPLTEDIILYGKWLPNADTQYTVQYYQQNLSDDEYTEITADRLTLTGVSDEPIAPITKSYNGFTLDHTTYEDNKHSAQTDSLNISGDGSLTVKVYFNRNQYHVIYDGNESDAGIVPTDETSYRYGATVTAAADSMTRKGYAFMQWSTQQDGSGTIVCPTETMVITKNTTLFAQWTPTTSSTDPVTAAYKVQHYQEQADGSYNLIQTEFPLYGDIGSTVSANVKSIEHYHVNNDTSTLSGVLTMPSVENGEVVVLTLQVYYDLDSFTVSYDLNGGTGAENVDYSSETVLYGSTVEIKAEPYLEGYAFTGWSANGELYQPEDTPSITSAITFVAQWTPTTSSTDPVTAAYKVQHYQEQTDGSYNLIQTEFPLYGDIGSTVSANVKSFDHYHVNNDISTLSGVLTMPSVENGEIVVLTLQVYYDLDSFTVSYDLNGGTGAENVDYSPETVLYGSTVEIKAEPYLEGYSFTGWSANGELYQPEDTPSITSAITFVAQWTPITASVEPVTAAYKVQHYQEQTDGSYNLIQTEFPLYGDIGSTVSANVKSFDHYHVNNDISTLSGVLTMPSVENGEAIVLTLQVYYDLDSLTVSYDLNGGTGAENVDYSPETVPYGSTVKLKTEPYLEGYSFVGWSDGTKNYSVGDSISVTEDIFLVAIWQKENVITIPDTPDSDAPDSDTPTILTPNPTNTITTDTETFTPGASNTNTLNDKSNDLKSTNSENPNTGVQDYLLLWSILLLLSGAGLVRIIYTLKKIY